jgi:ubiquinone/menaquinone biosynthesis C-methylase UbiE
MGRQVLERHVNRASRFWDRTADRYARQPIADQEAYQAKLEVTRRYFRSDMEVLEFGCGTGSTAIAHAPFVRKIHAIDLSSRMIEIARDKAKAGDVDNVTFTQADIMTLDAPAQSYDAVLGLNVLHLIVNRDAVLARVSDLLKPGGVFVTSTICMGDTLIFKALASVAGRLPFSLLPPLHAMTTAELLSSHARAGFQVEHSWLPRKRRPLFVVARKTSHVIARSGATKQSS